MPKESFESFMYGRKKVKDKPNAPAVPATADKPGRPAKQIQSGSAAPAARPISSLPASSSPIAKIGPASALPVKRRVGRPRKIQDPTALPSQSSPASSVAPPTVPAVARKRLTRGLLTSRRRYCEMILKILLKSPNHAMNAADVVKTIARRMDGKFTEADLSTLDNGQIRWMNGVQWTRKKMVMLNLLESVTSSGRGLWQLSDEGIEAAKSL